MNTKLMLQIADELAAHPENYDQRSGTSGPEGDCPAFVAVHALRLARSTEHGREPVWGYTAAAAAALLDIGPYASRALFASNPQDSSLEDNFKVTMDQLDAIPALADWLVDVDDNGNAVGGRLHHAASEDTGAGLRPETRAATFHEFWTLEPDPGMAKSFRTASAKVMASTLRLIAAGETDDDTDVL